MREVICLSGERWKRKEAAASHGLDDYDLCVICQSKTPYLRSTPIEQRRCYEEGVGQLCSEHYAECMTRI